MDFVKAWMMETYTHEQVRARAAAADHVLRIACEVALDAYAQEGRAP